MYSATPNRDKSKLINVYPYNVLDQLGIALFFGFFANPFHLNWAVRVTSLCLIPLIMNMRRNFLEERQYYVRELKMLRGGKVLKVVRDNLMGDTFVEWCEIQYLKLIKNDLQEFADQEEEVFLTKEGQLKDELAIEFENYKVRAINVNNQNLYFEKDGVVHEPELFEAVIRGYHLETSDFVINTADNVRALEPHYNR